MPREMPRELGRDKLILEGALGTEMSGLDADCRCMHGVTHAAIRTSEDHCQEGDLKVKR
jgi:hypothetical protein